MKNLGYYGRNGKLNEWMNDELYTLCHERDNLYKKRMSNKLNKSKEKEYKAFRNYVSKKIIHTKNSHYKNKLDSCGHDGRKTWQVLKEIMGKRTENMDQLILRNIKNSNPTEVANLFSKEFD